eukprot:12324657-Karenia_brevis.AAC.1
MHKQKCRIAGCQGGNPYVVQLAPQVSHNHAVHLSSLWHSPSSNIFSSSPSHVASSPTVTHNSHISTALQNNFIRHGIT